MGWKNQSDSFSDYCVTQLLQSLQGPKAATVLQEVPKKDLWIRAVVDKGKIKGKILLLCFQKEGYIMNNKKGCGNILMTLGFRVVRLSVDQLGMSMYDGSSR